MKHILFAILVALVLPAQIFSQKTLHVAHGCAYKTATEDTDLYTFESSEEAERIEYTKPLSLESSNPSGTSMSDNMMRIEGGIFQMGSNDSEAGTDEKPVHSVTVSTFYLSKYEVTNTEFAKFLNENGNQPEGGATWIDLAGKYDDERCRISQSGSTFSVESGYENYPVIFVNWYGATAYCKWLANKTGKNYRLPTEAEWEYAAANGNRHTKYSWGNDLPVGKMGGNVCDQSAKNKYANWTAFENYDDGYVYTAPVGQFNANDFGLYDMTGNILEWCADWYGSDYYKNSPSKDPKGPSKGDSRVCRGGSWLTYPESIRAALRSGLDSHYRDLILGFRPARD
ncbi:MAG: formylglycine-generating enzyme family protein [Saprospiraceae bacterium]